MVDQPNFQQTETDFNSVADAYIRAVAGNKVSFEWLQAQENNPQALERLADIYRLGTHSGNFAPPLEIEDSEFFVDKDPDKAFELYKKALDLDPNMLFIITNDISKLADLNGHRSSFAWLEEQASQGK